MVAAALHEIIRTYGTSVCEEPTRLRGLLADLGGGTSGATRILVHGLEAGVATELRTLSSGGAVTRLTTHRLVRRLQDDFGMAEQWAVWCVGTWAGALGHQIDVPAQQPAHTEREPPKTILGPPRTPPPAVSMPAPQAIRPQLPLRPTQRGCVVFWVHKNTITTPEHQEVPVGLTDVVAVALGQRHRLALRANGRITAWGGDSHGQATVPDGLSNVVAIAAGAYHSLALSADGRVTTWGKSGFREATVPDGLSNVVAIAAGADHNLALHADGRVTAWGVMSCVAMPGGSLPPPRQRRWGKKPNELYGVSVGLANVVAIAAGIGHSLALHADGRVTAWGKDDYRQCTPPWNLPNVVAIAAGSDHSVALLADGKTRAWGSMSRGLRWDGDGRVIAPGSNKRDGNEALTVLPFPNDVVAIAAGRNHTVALRSGGEVVAWTHGSHPRRGFNAPNGMSGVVAIAAFQDFGLAVRREDR